MAHTLVRPLLPHHEKLNVISKSRSEEISAATGQDGTAGRWLIFDLRDDSDWLFAAKSEGEAQQWCDYLNKGARVGNFDYEYKPAGKHRKTSLKISELERNLTV
jgi:hypothetical protein